MCLGRSNRQALVHITTDKEYNFSIQNMLNISRKGSPKSSFPSKTRLHINFKTTCVLPKGNSTSLQQNEQPSSFRKIAA